MAKLVGKPPVVELRCHKNSDGSYNAGIWVDGVPQFTPNSEFTLVGVDCEAIRGLWKKATDAWVVIPTVDGPCQDCFPQDFLDAESQVPPIR